MDTRYLKEDQAMSKEIAAEFGEEVSMESIQAVLLATEAIFNEIQQKKYNTVIPSADFDLVPGKGYREVKISKD